MAIIFDEKKRIFSIMTQNTTYQMKVDSYGFLLHLYYGAKITVSADYLIHPCDRGFSGNPYEAGNDRTYSLDMLPQEYPSLGNGDYRNSALIVRNGDGSESCDLRYVSHTIDKGKYTLPGLPAVYASEEEAETLTILLRDPVTRVEAELLYGVLEQEDVITRSVKIRNGGETPITVEKAGSACLDFLYGEYDLLSFYGRHVMERNLQRTRLPHGTMSIGSRRGASSHQYNPAVILAEPGTTEDGGGCYGMLFVFSGSFMCEAELDQMGQTRLIMGLQSDQFSYPLHFGEILTVPETVLIFSREGFSGLSSGYHRCIRKHICRGRYRDAVRPVLLNSWEAAYFDFNADTIVNLAKEAAALGMDMVVMDDGWFGERKDDNRGLGDWNVNEEKLGCPLKTLTGLVTQQGVSFGIWIEPEMVSEDSALYRAHPDWVLQIPGRKPMRSRNQFVLDFSRAEVRNHIFDAVCNVLDEGDISYVKWDMNRSLSEFYSMEHAPGKVAYEYVLGVYAFLERLLQRYPDLLIEGCSGGGGRFDAGMLYYTPQIWGSDNTDAADRVRIQYGTSFFYPASVVASHVSAVPNHQTGRVTSLKTRGIVAMAGTFGYELNPGRLSAEEREEIRAQIKEYKRLAKLIHTGDYYRLSDPFRDVCAAWQFVSPDKMHVLVHTVLMEIHGNMANQYIRLKGLDEEGIYLEVDTGTRYFGAALMHAGIPVPIGLGEYQSCRMEFVLIENENGVDCQY